MGPKLLRVSVVSASPPSSAVCVGSWDACKAVGLLSKDPTATCGVCTGVKTACRETHTETAVGGAAWVPMLKEGN